MWPNIWVLFKKEVGCFHQPPTKLVRKGDVLLRMNALVIATSFQYKQNPKYLRYNTAFLY
jgi:hypothetical protein